MQQDYLLPTQEPIVVVYTAYSWIEAVVVRSLLESAGIASPALGDGNLPDLAFVSMGIEIYTLKSQAERARQVIEEHLADIENSQGGLDEAGDGSGNPME
jgi:hypothetical protein